MAKWRSSVCGAVALVVCLPITAVKASPVTESFNFSASGFTPSGSPVNPWTGSFTITFDPAVSVGITPPPGTLDAFSSNLPAGYGTFGFRNAGTIPGELIIGDVCGSSCFFVSPGTDSASLVFLVFASGAFSFIGASLASTTTTNIFNANNLTLTATPLPTALPLFATGLGGLGLLGWRRKRKARAVA